MPRPAPGPCPALQLVAGEQIDHLFGARLGLSMMASAGLGNLVADVVGVSATHTVQENIKRIPFARPPRLRCASPPARPPACLPACMHDACMWRGWTPWAPAVGAFWVPLPSWCAGAC